MGHLKTAVHYHVDEGRVPEGGEFCRRVNFRVIDESTIAFELRLHGLDVTVYYDREYTNAFLDKLNEAIGVCEDQILAGPDESKEEPTSADATNTEDTHDPPDMGMDDRSRED